MIATRDLIERREKRKERENRNKRIENRNKRIEEQKQEDRRYLGVLIRLS